MGHTQRPFRILWAGALLGIKHNQDVMNTYRQDGNANCGPEGMYVYIVRPMMVMMMHALEISEGHINVIYWYSEHPLIRN